MKQSKQTKGQRYSAECETRILESLPELRGKFTELKIWASIFYGFTFNKSIGDTCEDIIKAYREGKYN